MVRIFSPGKIIYLIHRQKDFVQKENSMMCNVSSKKEVELSYSELSQMQGLKEIFLYHNNEKELFAFFTSMFRLIPAAGGLVKNQKGEYLFIFRNNKWDLPKGKIEKGEAIEVAAVREVEEECGIGGLKNVKELITTYHIYSLEEKQVLKPTYWYSMHTDDTSELVPQTEEGITQVKWIAPKGFDVVRKNTFPSILEVIGTVL